MRLTDPTEIRNALEQDYSDTFKSLHGFRPRNDVSGWTNDELYAEIESLRADVEAEFQAEAEAYPDDGEGWRSDHIEDREYFDDYNDFGGSMFGMTYDEAPLSGEDY